MSLVSACGAVTWRKLAQGETLFEQDDTSGSVYFVVRGRHQATTHDPIRGEIKISALFPMLSTTPSPWSL